MTTPLPKFGLYAITDDNLTPAHSLVEQVTQAIKGGAVMIQYRDKTSSRADKLKHASALLTICRQNNVPLIINDDVALASEIHADGVHLGEGDSNIAEARHRLGKDAIIGASCYNSYERAHSAQQLGASYVAFGRFFPSTTKPDNVQADVSLIHTAKQALHIPVVAIGGITPENATLLVEAGADFLAVVASVFSADDPQHAARRFAEIYYNHLNI